MVNTKQASVEKVPEQVNVGGEKLDVWPAGQQIVPLAEPTVRMTDFPDMAAHQAALVGKILEMEKDPRYAGELFKGGCGNKVRKLDEWRFPAARLIHARALRMCQLMLGRDQLFVDSAWGNVYRGGDYCMPHSHLRSTASVVYFLALGDDDPAHPLSGRFCIGDPRVQVCCQMEEGRMTHSLIPEVRAGSMIIFPSQMVHYVNPYTGHTPRITLAWNITLAALPGSAGERWATAKTPG